VPPLRTVVALVVTLTVFGVAAWGVVVLFRKGHTGAALLVLGGAVIVVSWLVFVMPAYWD
jgi:hypothetical protein